MFIRKTATRNKSASESYFTFRLVTSERTGKQVRQITLLNLGRQFDLPQSDWPRLCARIEALLAGQAGMLPEPEAIETLAQRYAARLIVAAPGPAAPEPAPPAVPSAPSGPPAKSAASDPVFAEVDVTSLQLIQPRSAGVEAAGLAAMDWLGIDPILADLGFNGIQRAAVAGSLIGRMAAPGSELATWRWLGERSALGELLGVNFDTMPLMQLYRTSDLLVRHRDKIEEALFGRIQDLFGLPVTVTLYDLTNTYFEGTAAGNPKAARGRSKEKRSDCPLVTLGLVLDGSGFVRRSKMFAGNVAESTTLEDMLKGLTAPKGALVIRFETGLANLAAGLSKPRAQKTLADIQQRIGRLKEKSRGIGQHYEITVTPDDTGTKAASITWTKTPVDGSMLTHPGVYCLRSNETTWDAAKLWHTYTMLTDLEAVFRGLKSELGLRPVFHHKEKRTEGHLFITVLAYQLVQAIRRKLEAAGATISWSRLREILSVQQRVTATFRQRDGRTLHVRKTTLAEPALRKIYDALGIDAAPGGVRKLMV
jgi:hypothetical protein